jgi:glycosyltransferase involved in cell wall biosynthesis
VRALRDRGHEVRVLCTDTYFDVERAEPKGGDVHRSLHWYWRDHAWPRLSLRQRRAVERYDRDVLAMHVHDFAPDAIAFFPMGGLPMSLVIRNRLPAVGVVHDDWLVYGPREDQWHRLLPRHRRARGIWLFVSAFTRDRALDAGWSLDETSVVPAGVDVAFRRPRPSPPWSWSLLFVGRLEERKGGEVALAALDELPGQATLTVAGPALVDAGARVRVLDPVAHADLPYAYAAADVVVAPSLVEEPFGLVPLEAMGLGRPVVATARGGAAEYIRHDVNALVVEPGDPAAVAAAVRRLADDPALRARLRHGGIATAEEHTAECFHARVEAALARAVRMGSPPPDAGGRSQTAGPGAPRR